jgi:predicted AAA+ superfamily ATPase
MTEESYGSFYENLLGETLSQDFIMAFPDGVIIDEAQKVPEIFDALKLHVDNSKHMPGKFILTGSSQFRLRENMTDSLAGRAAFIKLLPFSSLEFKKENILPDNPYDYILKVNIRLCMTPKKTIYPRTGFQIT